MSEHSPGPWEWRWDDLCGPHGKRVMGVSPPDHHEDGFGYLEVENPADRRLIAAAPEMLALLREWAEYDPGDLRSGGWCGDCDVHDGNCVHARTVTLLRRMNGRPPLTPPRT